MYRKRRRLASAIERMTSSGAWERKYAVRGLFASAAIVTAFGFILFVVTFPVVSSAIFLTLVVLAVIAAYIFMISRDVDFNGDLRE